MTALKKRAKFAGLASIALAATSAAVLFASQAAFATATPGDNGTVKVHDSSTPVTDHQNEPHDVCQFYLDGFGFDGAQSVTWYIDSWPPTGNGTEVLNGNADTGTHDAGDDTDVTGTYLHLRQHTAGHPTADHDTGSAHADAAGAGAGRSGASGGDRLPSGNGLSLQKAPPER